MKGKIILFDIDGTLFDVSNFLKLFHQELIDRFGLTDQDILQIKALYEEVKKENGYFLPSSFINKIIREFPATNKNEIEEIFQNIDLFEKSVYKDTSVIKNLANLTIFGIFSKGDKNFQKQKILFLDELLNNGDIYIFPNKISKIQEVFEKYKGYEIYLVDNDEDVLLKAKNLFPNATAILIDRNNRFQNRGDLIKIKDLNELKSIIYD